jgi:hypothetical protein
MRRFWRSLPLFVALVACTQASAPPTPAAERSNVTSIAGVFRAVSETASTKTGDVTVQEDALIFEHGQTLHTQRLDPRRGSDLISRDGDSYAAVAIAPAELSVELRRVSEQILAPGVHGLCGGDALTYVALAYDQNQQGLTLMAFAGDEPPGPETTRSRLCKTFSYAPPSGALTREGVVLR